LRVVINPSRDFYQNTTLTLFSAGTPALGAGFSNNFALTMALTAGGGMGETTEDGLLDVAYLPGAITIGASSGFSTRLTAYTVA